MLGRTHSASWYTQLVVSGWPPGSCAQTTLPAIRGDARGLSRMSWRLAIGGAERKVRVISDPGAPNSQPGWHIDPWNPRQLRYFDGHEWTGAVAAPPGVPVGNSPQQPERCQPTFAFPLGQRLLHLRALPQRADIDVACLVEDNHGRALAQIRPTSSSYERQGASRRFGMFDPHGAPLVFFIRTADTGVRDSIVITDSSGRFVGRLRRTNNFWQRLRSSTIDMTLECDQQPVGHTRVSVSPGARFSEVNEPVYDATGSVVATVTRQWRYVDTSVTFYDYTLECARRTTEPFPQLILGAAFAHYLYDRNKVGGPFASHTSFQ